MTAPARGAELVTRIRSAMRGFYGSNSTQYEQVGGTRRDDQETDAEKRERGLAHQGGLIGFL